MTCAYGETYLNDAMINLGEAFDYTVNYCKIQGDEFMELFIASGFAENFSKGNPKIVSGLSGTELAIEILQKSGKKNDFPPPKEEYEKSAEYWSGWVLAYYQWKTGKNFKEIHDAISIKDILKLYPILHEASEEKFVDTAEAIMKRKRKSNKLQVHRKICGYTQKELSEKTGINLRTLQQYETGAKDLSKASVKTIIKLANVLGVRVLDLM